MALRVLLPKTEIHGDAWFWFPQENRKCNYRLCFLKVVFLSDTNSIIFFVYSLDFAVTLSSSFRKTTAGHFCWNPFIWLVLTYVTSCTIATNQRKAMSHKHTNKCSQSTTEKTTRSASFLYEMMNGRIESRLVKCGMRVGINEGNKKERKITIHVKRRLHADNPPFFLF